VGIVSACWKVPPDNIVKATITNKGQQCFTLRLPLEQGRKKSVSYVFVVNTDRQPLNPIHPGIARILLKAGKAAVLKRYPFTIVLKTSIEKPTLTPLRLKLDPGGKTSGLVLLNDVSGQVVFAAELAHRGYAIKDALQSRRQVRRSRRNRHTRYRKPRFCNRRNKKKGWFPPSLQSRISNITTWVLRLQKLCPLQAISMELVKFDLQQMEQPEIQGTEYQQGILFGYEVREYLLEKWHRQCAYCGKSDVPLQVEHIQPKAKGGTDRVSNLCLACQKCNQKKGTQQITTFLKKKPEQLAKILAQAQAPLKDATAVNATRLALFDRLKQFGLPVECGSGGLTKFNRTRRGLPKNHWLDAACVGRSTPEIIKVQGIVPLCIKAAGHGCRQMCLMDRFGFPRTQAKAKRFTHHFRTGDVVRAVVPASLTYAGTYVGRMSAKARGYFSIATAKGTVTDIGRDYCRLLQRADGYAYIQKGGAVFSPVP
jgi:5-methylcytosine-specific restriction endonuclease McrA